MQKKGFTLVELLVVLALIAILAAVLIVIIRPAEIFKRGRDTQRQGDLRNLSAATDAFLAEMSQNPSLSWPFRGSCSSTSPGNIFFSIVPTNSSTAPTGWPTVPAGTATGTTSTLVNGDGWVPLSFAGVAILNLAQLPLDPRNGSSGADAGGTTTVTFAYSFTCDTGGNYEYATKLESSANSSLYTGDGGNQNNLYEVGPGKATLY